MILTRQRVLREYITDRELYDKIIDRYEKRAMTRNFTSWESRCKTTVATVRRYDNFNREVYKVGASYTDANQYLSLLNESDKALENLITYFKGVDDPVEIVFFGDHQLWIMQ